MVLSVVLIKSRQRCTLEDPWLVESTLHQPLKLTQEASFLSIRNCLKPITWYLLLDGEWRTVLSTG